MNQQYLRGFVEEKHRAALNMIALAGDGQWSPAQRNAYDALLSDAERAEEQIQSVSRMAAHVRASQFEAFDLFARKSLNQMTPAELGRVQNAMSTGTSTEGGYSVGATVSAELASLLKGYGFMRQVASQITTEKGGAMTYPTSDGTAESGEQLDENAAATSADPTFGMAGLNTYRFGSKLVTVPVELLQDSSVDIVEFLIRRFRDRIGRIQNLRFTTGTGGSQPTGLVTAVTVGKTGTTGQTTTVIYADLADLVDSVDDAHLGMPSAGTDGQQAGTGWMLSQTARKVVRKLSDTAGRPIWLPSYAGKPAQLLDYPAWINNDMAAPAASAKSIVFGNLSAYMIRDALGLRVLRLDDSAFALKGQVGFLAFARAGGNLLDANAVKAYQHPAS